MTKTETGMLMKLKSAPPSRAESVALIVINYVNKA